MNIEYNLSSVKNTEEADLTNIFSLYERLYFKMLHHNNLPNLFKAKPIDRHFKAHHTVALPLPITSANIPVFTWPSPLSLYLHYPKWMTLIECGLQFLNHWKQPLRPDNMFNFPAASPHFYSMCDARCHGAVVSSLSTRNGKEGGVEVWGCWGLQWFKAPCIFSIWRTLLVTESMVHWAMKEAICSPPKDRFWIQLASTLQRKKSISTSRLIWDCLNLSLK